MHSLRGWCASNGPLRQALVPAAVLLALAASAGCADRRPVVREPLREARVRAPVVLIPGITGTRLRDRESGKIVWGNFRSILLPRDGGDALVLAPGGEPGQRSRLETAGPVAEIRAFGVVKFEFYAALVRLMEANGYRTGDLAAPDPEDDFFIFSYDWRRSNVHAAGELARLLENLRRVRGEPVLQVNLVCQSNAARIARYLIKYGGVPLEQAESGASPPPDQVRVEKLIMVGTDHGGAIGILRDINRGRSYARVVGRKFRPEAFFGFESLYEALPVYRREPFFDAEGRTVDVDLFEPENWKRYGWGIYGRRAQQRLRRQPRPELFGDPETREAFLAEALGRARRLHQLLARDAERFGDVRYYMIQNAYLPTPDRALLERQGGEWRTWFGTDKRVRRSAYLSTLADAPGDGLATLASQLWVSPQEAAALARRPVYVPVRHRKIILNPAAHGWILEFLAD